eukprot:12018515-Alexandrium_andersonii.AAC.1
MDGCSVAYRLLRPAVRACRATPTRLRPPAEEGGRRSVAWTARGGGDASSALKWGGSTQRPKGRPDRQQH